MNNQPNPSLTATTNQLQGNGLHLVWKNIEDTALFAHQLSKNEFIQDLYINLLGDLGSGKTTFVRHLLQNFGFTGRVKSPTYTIVETYDLVIANQGTSSDTTFTLSHFDFYRFQDENEWEEAGFRDIFANPGLQLVEWPEKAQTLLPKADLEIHIVAQEDESRNVVLKSISNKGMAVLKALALLYPPLTSI